MVADDPTKSDATGIPVPANPQPEEEAETGQFVSPASTPDLAQADRREGELAPENGADEGMIDVAIMEAEEPVADTDSTELESAADEDGASRGDDGEAEDLGPAAELDEPLAAEAELDAGGEPDEAVEAPAVKEWYILKVQVNREDSIRAALLRRIKIEGLEEHFDEIVVPTEEVAEFNKSGKRKIVRRKLYPGYILVHMAVNDDTWFLVRETPGVGDFTGSSGKPTPMNARDVERILRLGVTQGDSGVPIKTAIPFKVRDRVRVKDGHFQNFEGEVDSIDEANGRITVMINIFNRSTPVELEHWQVESV